MPTSTPLNFLKSLASTCLIAGTTIAFVSSGYVIHIIKTSKELITSNATPTAGELPLSTEVFAAGGEKIGEITDESRYFVQINLIPDHVQKAFISAEDKNFYSHNGISFGAMLRSAFANLRGLRIKQGASTITQQLARIYYLNQERTLDRKLREAVLAVMLEQKLSKGQILELYLNRIYLGNHSYGVEAAARNYFRKPVTQLSVAEAALLAGLPPSPSRYAPHRHLKQALTRQKFVLNRMVEDGFLNATSLDLHLKSSLSIARGPESFPPEFGYVMGDITQDITKRLEPRELRQEGLRVKTTIDYDLQSKIAAKFSAAMESEFEDDVEGCLLALTPKTGAVLAMQGGRDFTHSQFNRCRNIQRPVGELAIPLLAALRLSQDANLLTALMSDESGDLTILDALSSPKPDLSAALFETIGTTAFRRFAKEMNLSLKRYDIGVVFGLAKGNPFSFATSYAALSHNGYAHNPHLIAAISDSFGSLKYQGQSTTAKPFFTEKAVYATRYALSKFSSHNNPDLMVATASNDLRDAWLITSTPERLYIYWFGSEHGESRLGLTVDEVKSKLLNIHKVMPALPKSSNPSVPEGVHFFRTAISGKRLSIPL